MAKLIFPFSIERPSTDIPATTASDVDIKAIDGMDATTVQEAIEWLKENGGGGGSIEWDD